MRRSVFGLVLCLAAVATMSACGGGSSSSGSPSAQGVDPKTWMGAVCQDTLDWANAMSQQSQSFTTLVSNASSLDQAKTAAVGFFDSLITRTESYLSQLKSAGTPSVSNGGVVALALTRAIQAIDDKFKETKTKAEALPTDDAKAFSDQLTAIGDDLDTAFTSIGSTFDSLNTSALEAAGKDIPSCQQLQTAGSSSP